MKSLCNCRPVPPGPSNDLNDDAIDAGQKVQAGGYARARLGNQTGLDQEIAVGGRYVQPVNCQKILAGHEFVEEVADVDFLVHQRIVDAAWAVALESHASDAGALRRAISWPLRYATKPSL